MFEVGFQELVMVALLALIVLGPEKLPKLAAQLGRWTGRARMMARNLRQQLETEVSYDDLMKQKEAAEAALRKAQEAPMNFHQDITTNNSAASSSPAITEPVSAGSASAEPAAVTDSAATPVGEASNTAANTATESNSIHAGLTATSATPPVRDTASAS